MRNFRHLVLLLTLVSSMASGCGTLMDHGFGPCPKAREGRIYGGVRADLECLGDQVKEPSAAVTTFALIDLPFSALLDTLLLPAKIIAKAGKTSEPPPNSDRQETE